MSSRGRGYGGRGSYNSRGGGYRGSYRGNSRGSYESRGGRGGGGYSSYNSDSRHNSTSGNRFTRDRIDDTYKKSYRSEASYSNRDYGGRSGSPERKRMRMDGSSSERRSHDVGAHYGGSYGGRQDNYSSERRSFVAEDRRRSPSREAYRKTSGMGPPREPLRSSTRPRPLRRSFRGRTMRSRGTFRGSTRSRGTFSSRRFGERTLGYIRAFRSIKGRSSVKSKEDQEDEASSTEEDWDADEKDEATEEKQTKPKLNKAQAEVSEESQGAGGEDTDKEADATSDAPAPVSRTPSHLACVHCKEKCSTFAGYTKHLLSSKHSAAMTAVARRHKAQLLRMRVAQRGAQRDLEASASADLAQRTTFCLICRLNHRTTRHSHNLTDTHRAMKRFLMPFCRICRMTFRSPMIYEHHICSVEHLKKKASQSAQRTSPKADGSADEGMDVDLDNFMTLDSVGDVDEVEDDDSGTEKKSESTTKKQKVEINIGSEHIKKMEVWWCELCRVYLRAEQGSAEEAEALRRHCRLRMHLGRYVQHRDTRTLRKHAERIHRQLHQSKDGDKEETAEAETETNKTKEDRSASTGTAAVKVENGMDSANTGNEDKLWADVDKDIGELLREVDPQGHEGSEDDDDLDRYDKFRKSDKKKVVEGSENNENTAEVTEKKNAESDTPV